MENNTKYSIFNKDFYYLKELVSNIYSQNIPIKDIPERVLASLKYSGFLTLNYFSSHLTEDTKHRYEDLLDYICEGSGECSFYYAKLILKGRYKKGEPYIFKSDQLRKNYVELLKNNPQRET